MLTPRPRGCLAHCQSAMVLVPAKTEEGNAMQWTTAIVTGAVTISLSLLPVEAQEIKKGTLSGTILSAGIGVPDNSQQAPLGTPNSGRFILTQVCRSDGAIRFLTGFGEPIVADHGPGCTTFVLGFELGQNTSRCFYG